MLNSTNAQQKTEYRFIDVIGIQGRNGGDRERATLFGGIWPNTQAQFVLLYTSSCLLLVSSA